MYAKNFTIIKIIDYDEYNIIFIRNWTLTLLFFFYYQHYFLLLTYLSFPYYILYWDK